MKWDVQLFELNYDAQESAAIQAVLDSGWITMGQKTLEFEHEFERYHRDVHVLTQHAYKSYSRYEDVGKMLFGLPPSFWSLDL